MPWKKMIPVSSFIFFLKENSLQLMLTAMNFKKKRIRLKHDFRFIGFENVAIIVIRNSSTVYEIVGDLH
jgi:hypothetical protein